MQTALPELLHRNKLELTFHMLEVGALPVAAANKEPFHALPRTFPGSRVTAFEVDEAVCGRLNQDAHPGVRFYPVALGRTEEERPFYETEAPMCSSLLRPNEAYLGLFQNLEVARLKRTTTIRTSSLDRFMEAQRLGAADFIKIDVQGAELEVFQGGRRALRDVLFIVTEVEFVPLYHDQPLFGDVTAFLAGEGFSFHKLLGAGGRSLRPITINNDPNFVVQQMWGDAVYLRDLLHLDRLRDDQLLKTAVLGELYGSPDVAHHLLAAYDARRGTRLAGEYLAAVS